MNQAETFEWLRERSSRLEQVEAENERLNAEVVRLTLEVARLTVRPIVEREMQGEDVGSLMELRLD